MMIGHQQKKNRGRLGLAERSCWASSMLMCAGIAANAAPVRMVAIGASNTHRWYVGNEGAYLAQLQALLIASALLPRVLAIQDFHRRSAQRSPAQPVPRQPDTGFKRGHSGVSKQQGSGSTTAIDTVGLFRLTSCHVCGWKCARRRSPWNGQAHQITTVPPCGKCGLRCPGMTQASLLARFSVSGLPHRPGATANDSYGPF
jgi:hypothetical protein